MDSAAALHFCTTPDGRKLAYAEFGNPSGAPVFSFHGLPGSRLSLLPPLRTSDHGWRIIAPDRPGIGRSDPLPRRSLTDWPKDVAALAGHLGLDRFHVMGESAGAPHAVVCAWALPDRVIAAASVCGGLNKTASDAEQMESANRLFFWISTAAPWLMSLAYVPTAVLSRRFPGKLRSIMESFAQKAPPEEGAVLSDPAVLDAFVASMAEAFRQGVGGVATESRLVLGKPWPFDLATVSRPVSLWHGENDHNVPLAVAQRLAGEIPGATLTVIKNAGHGILATHWPEILEDLKRRA